MNKKTIWKFPLQLTDSQQIDIPMGYKILCVQAQNGQGCLWAEVMPDAQVKKATFLTLGTGHPIQHPANMEYLGTYQTNGGSLVWHVYELINP